MPNTRVWCNTELTTNTQTRKEKTTTVENLHATVDELKASMEILAMEVTKLFAQVSHQIDVHEDMQGELQLMKGLEMSERILHTDVPSGKKIWSTRWCHRRKGAGVRPRFVVRKFRDTDWETAFSGVPGLVVVRILLCINTILESSAVLGDFSVAFMSTPLHDTEFIKPPIEAESDSRYVWKLRKALNDLKKASQLFSNNLSDILVDELGFEKCPKYHSRRRSVDDRRGRATRDSSRRPQRPSPKRYAFLTSSLGKRWWVFGT